MDAVCLGNNGPKQYPIPPRYADTDTDHHSDFHGLLHSSIVLESFQNSEDFEFARRERERKKEEVFFRDSVARINASLLQLHPSCIAMQGSPILSR